MYLQNLCCKQWKLKEEEGGSPHCLNLVIQFRKLRNAFWKSPCNTIGNTYQEMQMWEADHDRSLYSLKHMINFLLIYENSLWEQKLLLPSQEQI